MENSTIRMVCTKKDVDIPWCSIAILVYQMAIVKFQGCLPDIWHSGGMLAGVTLAILPGGCWWGCHPTPWKINGWNLQPSPMKRKENDLNQTSMSTCSMLIFRCVREVPSPEFDLFPKWPIGVFQNEYGGQQKKWTLGDVSIIFLHLELCLEASGNEFPKL